MMVRMTFPSARPVVLLVLLVAASRPSRAGEDAAAGFWMRELRNEDPAVRQAAARALRTIGPPARDAVPALFAVLQDKDPWARALAASALVAVVADEPSRVVPALVEALSDQDWRVRQNAAGCLGRLGPKGRPAVPALIERLGDEHKRVRGTTVWALQKIGIQGEQDAIAPLVGMLGDGARHWFGGDAADALAQVGPVALPTLVEALSNEKTVLYAARGIAGLGEHGKRAMPALLEAARLHPDYQMTLKRGILSRFVAFGSEAVPVLIETCRDPELGGQAVWALGLFGREGKDAVPVLANHVRHGPYRRIAAEALGKIGPAARAAVPALLEMLKDPDPHARADATAALRQIRPPAAADIPELVEDLGELDAYGKSPAFPILKRMGLAAVPALTDALKHEHKKVRCRAARLLGEFGPQAKAALPALRELLKDRNDPARRDAALAAWRIAADADAAVPVLVEALGNEDWVVRSGAVQDLGEIGPAAKAAVPAIRRELRKKGFVVCFWGAAALGKIGQADRETVQLLLDLLPVWPLGEHNAAATLGALKRLGTPAVPAIREKLKANDAETRSLAAYVLGEMGAAANDAVPDLVAALKDPDRQVRSSAAAALRKLGPAPRAAVPSLAAMLKNEPGGRADAANALAAIGPEARPSLQTLTELLPNETDPHTRGCILRAVAAIDPQGDTAVPVLIRALRDREEGVRTAAAKALGSLGRAASDAVPHLVEALKGKEARCPRTYAVEALLRIDPSYGEVAVPYLIQQLDGGDPYRRMASATLAEIGPPAVPALVRALRDERHRRRVSPWAARALGKMGAAALAAVPVLKQALHKDELHATRLSAAIALWRIDRSHEPIVIPVLVEELDGGPWERAAARALAEIGPPAVPALAGTLDDVTQSVEARIAAADTLGRIGPAARSAVPTLSRARSDLDRTVREAAAQALTKIQPKTDSRRRRAPAPTTPRPPA